MTQRMPFGFSKYYFRSQLPTLSKVVKFSLGLTKHHTTKTYWGR